MDQERYSIIFSSVTGNTKLLADALRETLPKDACDYFGASENAPTDSKLLYVGFWTDKGNADNATLALLQKCAVPLLAVAMPQAVWLLADTPALTEAGLLPGEDVHKHLTGCGQAILLAVTLGPGVDAQIRRAGVGDIAAGVASDALGSALAEQAADAAEAQLRQWAATEGKYLTGRFSPGYGDWDIAVQPLVAAALDTVRKAGLCVTDTNLMTPRKSVTALLGVSDHPVKGQLAGCGHCVLRTRCEYRKRGKTCASE